MLTGQQTELTMTPEEFQMIRDLIHERSGIYFAENKIYLIRNRLQRRMDQLEVKTVRDYFYLVKYDTAQREFNVLMDLVTTNETSFFRNEPQLLSFADEVLPDLQKRKASVSDRSLRIWSAGCSTGEEAYTLAMILLDRLGPLSGWNIEIVANDISEEVLGRARRAEYFGTTMRNVPDAFLRRYFTEQEGVYRLRPEVKAMVKFSHLNLHDERQVSLVGNVDVVFCRNVMIYFSEDGKKKLVRNLFNSLRPGGYLYIGHSETLHGLSKAFRLVYLKNALVYQKEATASEELTHAGYSNRHAKSERDTTTDTTSRALDLLARVKQ